MPRIEVIVTILLLAGVAATCVGCSQPQLALQLHPLTQPLQSQLVESPPPPEGDEAEGDAGQPLAEEPEEPVQNFSQPIMITSVGQSTDAPMMGVLCSRAGLEYNLEMTLVPAQLTRETKTLLLVLGGGPKCLDAFGTTAANEIARARGLVLNARRMSIPVVAMHIGGSIRRGPHSDQIVREVGPLVDRLIVVAEGNADGLFNWVAQSKGIPLDSVEDINASVGPLDSLVRPDAAATSK